MMYNEFKYPGCSLREKQNSKDYHIDTYHNRLNYKLFKDVSIIFLSSSFSLFEPMISNPI